MLMQCNFWNIRKRSKLIYSTPIPLLELHDLTSQVMNNIFITKHYWERGCVFVVVLLSLHSLFALFLKTVQWNTGPQDHLWAWRINNKNHHCPLCFSSRLTRIFNSWVSHWMFSCLFTRTVIACWRDSCIEHCPSHFQSTPWRFKPCEYYEPGSSEAQSTLQMK